LGIRKISARLTGAVEVVGWSLGLLAGWEAGCDAGVALGDAVFARSRSHARSMSPLAMIIAFDRELYPIMVGIRAL